jgi:hypothetical protein
MTPEERQLITGLFDRMRGFTLAGKDGEAEALIKSQVGGLPDAPYMLVQSVLVQEHALQQADSRIKALEEQVRTLQEEQQRAQPAPTGGSFLGGLFGGGRPAASEPERRASVPAIGARATPSAYGGGQSAWGGGAPQPPTQPSPWNQATPQAAPASGGFLQSAMSTAAGVAGGMLAANAISSWLGGGHHTTTTGSTPTAATATPPQQPQVADAQTAGPTEASHATEAPQAHDLQHDASYQDDDDGWFGGGGGDFDA